VGLRQRQSGLCFRSYETLAEAAECTRSTVAEAINALGDAGVFTTESEIRAVGRRGRTARLCDWPRAFPDKFLARDRRTQRRTSARLVSGKGDRTMDLTVNLNTIILVAFIAYQWWAHRHQLLNFQTIIANQGVTIYNQQVLLAELNGQSKILLGQRQ
jgi:hypothetical protein